MGLGGVAPPGFKNGGLVNRIRTLIADDTALLRHLLSAQLAREPDIEVVGVASDGDEAVDAALRLRPDVVLMDLEMPGRNGTQATEAIVARLPSTRVILLTAHENLAPLGRLAGAHRSLLKSCTPTQLADSIRSTASAPSCAAPATTVTSIAALAARHGLTERERLVVEHAANTELTVRQIAVAVLEATGQRVSESAVKHTLERAMVKMRVEPHTRAALVRHLLLETRGAVGIEAGIA